VMIGRDWIKWLALPPKIIEERYYYDSYGTWCIDTGNMDRR
jgi:hypothetical protein